MRAAERLDTKEKHNKTTLMKTIATKHIIALAGLAFVLSTASVGTLRADGKQGDGAPRSGLKAFRD